MALTVQISFLDNESLLLHEAYQNFLNATGKNASAYPLRRFIKDYFVFLLNENDCFCAFCDKHKE